MRIALAFVVVLAGCGSSVVDASPTTEDAAVGAADADASIVVDTEVEDTARPEVALDSTKPCVPGPTQCSNCLDDDGDGTIDGDDPECHGARDNDEKTFGLGGAPEDPCRPGCWFDDLRGADDPCTRDGKCVTGTTDPRCKYDPDVARDPKRCPPASDACVAKCKPLVPEGCDCAGCCVVRRDDKLYLKRLVDTCSAATLDDEAKCPSCTLWLSCAGPGATYCPAGLPACDPTTPCPTGQYCLTGCCIKRE